MNQRIFLSPPHMSGKEVELVQDAIKSNWVAPTGPDLELFEKEICAYTGASYAVGLASGTAALHLSLILNGIKEGDEVICSSFTFAGTAFPVCYQNAEPVFVDSETGSWNIDPKILEYAIEDRIKKGKKPKAVIVVHLYGQSANIEEIIRVCNKYDVVVIEDAAESMGSYVKNRHTGVFGELGIFSFNGNKIITTSGGGALVGSDKELIEKARYLSTQARSPVPFYHHQSIGYNYRLSNICAAIGRGQLNVIEDRVKKRREIYNYYRETLSDIEEISFIPNDAYGRSNCWLTCIIIDSEKVKPDALRVALEKANVESRHLWKPMHTQPVFQRYCYYGNGVSDSLFEKGLCLPSGSAMVEADLNRVVNAIRAQFCTSHI